MVPFPFFPNCPHFPHCPACPTRPTCPTRPAGPKSPRIARSFTLSATVALAIGALGCGASPAVSEKGSPAVKAELLTPREERQEARFSGSLEAAAQVDLAFRQGGYVEAIERAVSPRGKRGDRLDVGDAVKKGMVLARIRSGDQAQRVASAKARVAEAKASGLLAQQELQRSRKLFEARVLSGAELDARVAEHDSATASAQAAAAQLAEASIALGDTTLVAPMDGVIVARHVEEGSLINPGTIAFTIADTRTVKAVFGVPQSVVRDLEVGGPVVVALGDGPEGEGAERLIDSAIRRIAPAADARGRLFSVEAGIDNQDGSLRPGSVVGVRLPARDASEASLVVPLGAVVRSPHSDRGFAVFVVDGDGPRGAARRREVELGDFVGNGVTVLAGLAPGDRVVTAGSSLLSDGGPAVVIP